jgi:hypothetical protein
MRLPTGASRFVFIFAHPAGHVGAPVAAAARGLKVVDGVAMIKHQLPLQTAFWRGET